MMEANARTTPRAEILTLGDTRFGVLAGGPFDGRCYPLPEGADPRGARRTGARAGRVAAAPLRAPWRALSVPTRGTDCGVARSGRWCWQAPPLGVH